VLEGDALKVLKTLEAGSVQTCVTSPPYWGLRDYGTATWEGGDLECDHLRTDNREAAIRTSTLGGGKRTAVGGHEGEQHRSVCGKCGAKRIDSQLGLESTPEEYVANLVEVFREVRRVLRDDGTVWFNLGDSYFGAGRGPSNVDMDYGFHQGATADGGFPTRGVYSHGTLKSKDLCGIPWRVAFALQADGWWLRSDIIWAKPNPMPESVTDRPTRAHEYVFLLSKSARYFYDADAIREEPLWPDGPNALDAIASPHGQGFTAGRSNGTPNPAGRNKRSVWTVTTQPYAEAHFATFPPKLIEPCILAGSPPKCCGNCGKPWGRVTRRVKHPERNMEVQREKAAARTGRTDGQVPGPEGMVDEVETLGWRTTCSHDDPKRSLQISDLDPVPAMVLDPFCGSGTTGVVALRHNRSFIGIELNSEYCEMARNRIRDDAPLMNHGMEVV
jgi:DNA modification methylase